MVGHFQEFYNDIMNHHETKPLPEILQKVYIAAISNESDLSMAAICVTNVYELDYCILTARGDVVRAAIFNHAALRARRTWSGEDTEEVEVLKSNLKRIDGALYQENGVPEGMNEQQFLDWLWMRGKK